MKKKFLSIALAIALTFTMSLPVVTYADPHSEPPMAACCVIDSLTDGETIVPFWWNCSCLCNCPETGQCFCPPCVCIVIPGSHPGSGIPVNVYLRCNWCCGCVPS